MFWSAWANPSTIQTASMDGSAGSTLHQDGMIQPNNIALDIPSQVIYWTDGALSNIQYSNYSGLNRGVLIQLPSSYIFGISLDSFLVFFGDWGNNTIRYLHRLDDQSPVLVINDNLTTNAGEIVMVYPDKQPAGERFLLVFINRPNNNGKTIFSVQNGVCNDSSCFYSSPSRGYKSNSGLIP